jgi:hypothetical protein
MTSLATPRSFRAALVALALLPAPAVAQETAPAPAADAAPFLTVELNRLEPVEGACRIYLVLTSTLPEDLTALQLDLVAFGADRVVAGRMAVDLAPLPGAKETVRLFDWPQIDCASIGRILVNDVPACATGEGALDRCVRRIETSQVGTVPLTK